MLLVVTGAPPGVTPDAHAQDGDPSATTWSIRAGETLVVPLAWPVSWVLVQDESLARVELVSPAEITVRAGAMTGTSALFLHRADGAIETITLRVEPPLAGDRVDRTSEVARPSAVAGPIELTYRADLTTTNAATLRQGHDLRFIYSPDGPVHLSAQVGVRGTATQPLQSVSAGLQGRTPWGTLALGQIGFGLGRAWATGLTGVDVGVRAASDTWLGLTWGVVPAIACCRLLDPDSPTVFAARASHATSGWQGHVGGGLVVDPKIDRVMPLATVGMSLLRPSVRGSLEAFLSGDGGGLDAGFDVRPTRALATQANLSIRSAGAYQPHSSLRSDRLSVGLTQRWDIDRATQVTGSFSYGSVRPLEAHPLGNTWAGLTVHRSLGARWGLGAGYAFAENRQRPDLAPVVGRVHGLRLNVDTLGKHRQSARAELWLPEAAEATANTTRAGEVSGEYSLRSAWAPRVRTSLATQARWTFAEQDLQIRASADGEYEARTWRLGLNLTGDWRPSPGSGQGQEQARLFAALLPGPAHQITLDVGGRVTNGAWRLDRRTVLSWTLGLGYQYDHARRTKRAPRDTGAGTPTISGTAFLDHDLDGLRGPTEPPLAGVSILIDDLPVATTQDDGAYEGVAGLGTHIVDVEGWNVTGGPVPMTWDSTTADHVVDLPCYPGGRLIVRAFEDLDGNGRYDASDVLVRDAIRVPVYVEGEAFRIDVRGIRDLPRFPLGTHRAQIDLASLPPGLTFAGEASVFPLEVRPFETAVINVPMRSVRSLTGRVRYDADGDGQTSDADPPAVGISVHAGADLATTTDADGRWRFDRVPPARYDVLIEGAPPLAAIDARPAGVTEISLDTLLPWPDLETLRARVAGRLETSPSGALVLDLGDHAIIEAQATYDSGARERAQGVVWEIDDAAIAMLDGQGRLLGVAPGTTRLRARRDEMVSPWLEVEVRSGSVVALAIVERDVRLPTGGTMTLSARAIRVDGHIFDVAGGVRWTVEDAAVATVTVDAALVAVAPGRTRVFAELGGVQAFPLPIEVVAEPAAP